MNRYGNIVAIIDGKIETLWEFKNEAPYDKVPKTLHDIVINANINNVFASETNKLGIYSNILIIPFEHNKSIRFFRSRK